MCHWCHWHVSLAIMVMLTVPCKWLQVLLLYRHIIIRSLRFNIRE